MGKYIWITLGMILLVVLLAWQQAPLEPDVAADTQTTDDNSNDVQASESDNIRIAEPAPGAKASSPLFVKGEARTFESTLQLRLKNATGEVLAEKTVTYQSEESGVHGSFGELLLFDSSPGDTGVLEAYSIRAEDGSENDMVSIPLIFENN